MLFNKKYLLVFMVCFSSVIFGGDDENSYRKLMRRLLKGFIGGIAVSATVATIGDGFSWARKTTGFNAQQHIHGLIQVTGVTSLVCFFLSKIPYGNGYLIKNRISPFWGLKDDFKKEDWSSEKLVVIGSPYRLLGFFIGLSSAYFLGSHFNNWLNAHSISGYYGNL